MEDMQAIAVLMAVAFTLFIVLPILFLVIIFVAFFKKKQSSHNRDWLALLAPLLIRALRYQRLRYLIILRLGLLALRQLRPSKQS